MSCRCSENKDRLAHYVGQDAIKDLPEDLRRSLSNCPQCRKHYQQLTAAMGALQHVQATESILLRESVWSSLSYRLPDRRVSRPRHDLLKQRIVPTFSMTAACLALLLVLTEGTTNNSRIYQTASNYGSRAYSRSLVPVGVQSASWDEASAYNLIPQDRYTEHYIRPYQSSAPQEFLVPHNSSLLDNVLKHRSEFERDLQRARQ